MTIDSEMVCVPRERLEKLLTYADADYVPNVIFEEFEVYLDVAITPSHDIVGVDPAVLARLKAFASPSPSHVSVGTVRVKPLEWLVDENNVTLHRADFYTIESEFRQGFALHTAGLIGVSWFETIDEAKAAAQADYESRILSGLAEG